MGARNGKTTQAVDKETLLARRLRHTPVDLSEYGGGTVVVRGLSRHEVLHDLRAEPDGAEELTDKERQALFECRLVSLGMVDPELSMEDVAEWARNSVAGEIEEVTDTISRLSGLDQGAGKTAYKSIPEQPGS